MAKWAPRLAAAVVLLGCAAPLVAQPAAAPAEPRPADFTTAPVTAEMAMAAVDLCASQLRAGNFDAEALTSAGWVRAISADGEPVIRGYRHPDNMILLNTMDSARGPDKCAVMAPAGRGLTLESMQAALAARDDIRPARRGDATSWTQDNLGFEMRPMGNAGVVVEIQARNR